MECRRDCSAFGESQNLKNHGQEHSVWQRSRRGGVRNTRWYQRNRENIQDYSKWCRRWGEQLFRICKPSAIVAVFNSTRTIAHVQVALEECGFYARDVLVYRRSSGIPKGFNAEAKLKITNPNSVEKWRGWHSCFRSEWEGVVVVQKPLENNYLETLLKYGVGLFNTKTNEGRFQSNIFENLPREKRESFNVHCTVKPLSLMRRLVELFVPIGEENVVIDPFAGSGTTLVAAKELKRTFIGIEIVKEYIPIIETRLASIESSEEYPDHSLRLGRGVNSVNH